MGANANLEDATLLHTLGYPVLMTGEDKNPGTIVGKSWGDYEWDTDKFVSLFKKHPNAQIGLRLWPYVDVEIDAPPDDDGSFARKAEALLIELGGDVETPSWTSRRGKHVLFKVDSEQQRVLEAADAPASLHIGNLEVRLGTNSQTQSLIPPSVTDGVARAWINDLATTDVARLPDALFAEVHAACLKRQEKQAQAGATDAVGVERPGDVFNERVTWEDVLGPFGWTARGKDGEVRHWTRPGKKEGVSATTGFCKTSNRPDCFYSFSDAPEIAPLEAQKSYTKFEAYTMLNHGGDFSAASAELVKQGYTPDYGDADEFEYDTDDPEEPASDDPVIVDDSASGPPPDRPVASGLPDFVFDNPIGRYVLHNDPHTEADRNAVLLQSWEFFGNYIGKGVRFPLNNSNIYANGFLAVVGDTGLARKGTSLQDALAPYRTEDAFFKDYLNLRMKTGISSGEGVVSLVADSPTNVDSRAMFRVEEMRQMMVNIRKQDSTLSAVLRQAYDGGALTIPTRKDPLTSSNAHISIIAHTTESEFSQTVDQLDVLNGLLNRFMYVSALSEKVLPNPGEVSEAEIQRVANAISAAQEWVGDERVMRWSPGARPLWEDFYISTRTHSGNPLVDAVMVRSTNHVIKYAMRHAVLDRQEEVTTRHLDCALAIWELCKQTAIRIFERMDPVADDRERLYNYIKDTPGGVLRTDMNRIFDRSKKFSEVTELLVQLERSKRVGKGTVTRGKDKLEVWKVRK